MTSLDCESTGLDLHHGARPFFVTTCDESSEPPTYWEWDVNPLTREVSTPKKDVQDIQSRFSVMPEVVFHNAKFDVQMLQAGGIILDWNWDHTQDTIFLAHILESNQPKNLTDLALRWLGKDILPLEKALEKATQEARRWCRSHLKEWRIAKKGEEGMPSAKEKTWKYDSWLPLTLRRLENHGPEEWDTVLSDYANEDSQTTLLLWLALSSEVKARGLWEYYLVRRPLMWIIKGMEWDGATVSREQLVKLRSVYQGEEKAAREECVSIAREMGQPLELPKSGNNNSLLNFCFGDDGLNLPVMGRTETGNPSLDAAAMDRYDLELEQGSTQHKFIKGLRSVRKRGKSLEALGSYERYWVPLDPESQSPFGDFTLADWFVLHSSLNPTGTDTLRMSSNNPNSQNVDKHPDNQGYSLRSIFSPAPGREWWSLDYENLELRIPTYEAGEKELIEVFDHPERAPYFGSYHLAIFDLLHPNLFKEHGKEVKSLFESTWYQWVKNGNFAIIYGAQEATADSTYRVRGAFNRIRRRFPRIAELSDKQIKLANKRGYVETIPDKTVNHLKGYPLCCSRSERGGVMPTIPLNYHVSGTAMWCTCKAMIRCDQQLREWMTRGFDGRLILQVHDELVFDFPKKGNPVKDARVEKKPGPSFRHSNLWRVRALQGLMRMSGDDVGVPTPVSAEYHAKDWSKGVKV